MKKLMLFSSVAIALFVNKTFGQGIPQSQVSSIIVNHFQQKFSTAYNIEWELDGEDYKVEFETGYGTDWEVWFDKTGRQIRQVEEISKRTLPQKVLNKISVDFGAYRVDDVKRITDGNRTTYALELKSFTEEWKMMFDNQGNILSKVAD